MGIKTKVLIGNEWVNGIEVGFKPKKEDWNLYELEDGSILRVRPIVTKVVRTKKFHDTRNDPIYHVSSNIVLEADVPESLKKKG